MVLALKDRVEQPTAPRPAPASAYPGFRPDEALRAGRSFIHAHLTRAMTELADAKAALAADPADGAAAVKAARLHRGLGEITRMFEVLTAIPARGPPSRSFYQDGGQLFLALGLFREAERWLSQAVALGFRPVPALLSAHREAAEGKAADKRRGLLPDDKRRYLNALERLVRGRPATALELSQALTASRPGFAPAWLIRRGALEMLGRSAEAEALTSEWLAAAPGSAAGVGAAMSFRLSPRGLAFDPREPLVLRGAGETLTEVATPEALRAGGDRILYLDRGGGTLDLEPVIPLASAGPQQTRFSYRAAPKFVAALEGGALLGRGVVLNRDGEMPAEAWPPCHMRKAGFARVKEGFACDPALFAGGLYPVRVFDTPALLMAAPTDGGFGDWVLNLPPRLALAEAAGLDCPIVLREGVPDSFVEMLASLGWDRRRIVYHDPNGLSLFPRLYTTSWPLLTRDQAMRDLFEVYRRSPGRRRGPGERIYLSREGVSARPLVNEAEIRRLFEARGFRAVRPESLGLQQAKDLIAGADLIAGPYGSAFLNVVHAPRPPPALVILPPYARGFLNEVALWVGGCGGRFAYLHGQAEPGAGEGGPWSAAPAQVEAALDEFLAAADPA